MKRAWGWMFGGPSGRLLWWQLAAELAAMLAGTWAVYAATNSALLSAVPMFVVLVVFKPLHRRAARIRPFPRYPDRAPATPPAWRSALFIVAWIGVVLGLIIVSASAADQLLGFQPGPWFWFSLWFLGPMMFWANYHATQPPDGNWSGGRPRPEPSPRPTERTRP